ncbi:MAG: hypothetical protein QGD88_07025 [Anaerolineae bacterium]|nr:hypothetical protein [Anaerolineae bacterium]
MASLLEIQEQEIRKLIAAGTKISAVKLYLEFTAVGLREAKDAVDAIERGRNGDVHSPDRIGGHSDLVFEDHIRGLLAKRQKILTIKLYLEILITELKAAKKAVDAIKAQISSNPPQAPDRGKLFRRAPMAVIK